MLGVGELIAPQQWQRLAPLLSVRQALGYNFNVMPPAVLSAVVGLPESAMMPVVEGRREQPIWSLNRLAMLTGVHVDLDEMSLVEYPSQFMRISAWNPAAGATASHRHRVDALRRASAVAQGLRVFGAGPGPAPDAPRRGIGTGPPNTRGG